MPKQITLAAILLVVATVTPAEARRRAVEPARPFSQIDVIELYTAEAVTANGENSAAVEHKIRVAVAAFNADLQRSGILGVRLNLVYVGPVDLVAKQGGEMLDVATASEDVLRLRDLYRADLVGIWTGGGIGIALTPNVDAPIDVAGFHVIPANQPEGAHIFSHEVGHNLGLLHEHGVCRTDAPAFRDIMTTCSGASFLPALVRVFTNPVMNYLGVPIGPQDAASIIRAVAPKVAEYR